MNHNLSAIGIGAEIQHLSATNFDANLRPRCHALATSSGVNATLVGADLCIG